ncbi:MAG: hypothetical protein ACF8MJ_12455 [Phycisphaerales bacterium JB050]
MAQPRWSRWRPFPHPRSRGVLHAPFGPGVYDLRHKSDKESVLFGIGSRCAQRMSSLVPKPWGCGTRNNSKKREYVACFINDIEYRTMACDTREQAAAVEREIKRDRGHEYRFGT